MNTKTTKRLGRIVNVGYICMVAAIAFVVFKFGMPLIMPFILAMCLVAMTQPVIRRVGRRMKKGKPLLSVLFLVLLYALLGTALFWLSTNLFAMCRNALRELPRYYTTTIAPLLGNITDKIEAFTGSSAGEWLLNNEGITGWLQNLVSNISRKGLDLITGFSMNVPKFLVAFIFTIMLSFSISLQYGKVVAFLKRQLPRKAKTMLANLRQAMVGTVLKYLRAFLILMLITFTELSIGLLILKVPNAIGFAALIALLDILPILGTGTVLIPWALIELLNGNYAFAIGMIVLYAVITIIRNIIEPKVVGSSLGLNPVVSLVAIYLGFKLFGILGMILLPIITQILLALHKNGSIRLYREERQKHGKGVAKEAPGHQAQESDGSAPPNS